ncbi:MAG: hypothetical protein QXO70_00580 [Candidatus Pacearchaeota archaeon]
MQNKTNVHIISVTNEEIYKEYQRIRKKEVMSNNYFLKYLLELYKKEKGEK